MIRKAFFMCCMLNCINFLMAKIKIYGIMKIKRNISFHFLGVALKIN